MKKTALLKSLDAVAGNILCRLCGRLPSVAVDNEKVSVPAAADLRRILVIRPGGMGDMLVLLPVLKVLRQHCPRARIDLACESRNLDVLRISGLQDNAFVYDAHPVGFLRALRTGAYDVAIDTEQFHHFSALFAFLSHAPIRIGFKINPQRNPLYTHLVNYAPDGKEGEQFMRLIEPLGIRHVAYRLAGTLADTPIALSPPPPRELTPPEGAAPLVVLHVGASTAFKRWPADRFAALAVRLHRRHGDRIVLIGNRHDQPIAAQVAARVGDAAPLVDAAGNLALAETAALIKQARLFVGSDSGVAHLAIALGVRTVILFGPSDHLKWGAEDARHAVVRRAMPCAPCFIFGYHKPCRSLACMTSIAVDEVARACETVAGEDRASTACRTAAPGADAAAPATPG